MLELNLSNGANDNNDFADQIGNANTYIPIPQAYAGRSIFITGGTGFMGKVLVEKLLRSCPNIKHIYLLMRPKREQTVEERLAVVLKQPIFEALRQQHPKQLLKIIPIAGDITVDHLGISENDQQILCENVTIVFHSAATVRFDEHLKVATNINMLGTRRVIELCKRMKGLEAFIHVSTAFTNCDRFDVDEILYPMTYKPEDIITFVNNFPDDIVEELTPSLLGKRPNTYTFTKALAEHMVNEEAKNLPVDIVRPAIVTAALREPMIGWIDNFNGSTGLATAIGNGLLRTMSLNPKCLAHQVPVDVVINLIIAAAWRRMTNKTQKLRIYNCCSSQRNPLTWKDFKNNVVLTGRNHPFQGCVWYPVFEVGKGRILNNIIGSTLPLHIVALLTGRWTNMSKIREKIKRAAATVCFFTTRHWNFKDGNVEGLLHELSAEDLEIFMFDVSRINWSNYVYEYMMGVRKFLLKQNPDSLVRSRTRMKRLRYAHYLFPLLMLAFGFLCVFPLVWAFWH